MAYNENFTTFYIVLCLFFFTRQQPLLAALTLSVSMSIKGGTVIILPALLGCVHYSHGTITLLKSVLIIISVQVIVALPFIYDPVARLLGFKMGA